MNVLFESYTYQKEQLLSVLPKAYIQELPGDQAQTTHVGYLGPLPNIANSQAVVILPKAFLSKDNKVFGNLAPEELFELTGNNNLREQLRQSGTMEFLFRVSVWLFKAIERFAKRNAGSTLIEQSDLQSVFNTGEQGRSALELVQSLIQFYRDQQGLLTYIKRYNVGQRGTVSWSRTISKQLPVLQNGQPLYSTLIGKQKHVNFDEDLLRIFVSTINQFKSEFGFRVEVNSLYEPLTKADFDRFKQTPTRKLKQIRGQYFNDQLVRLWNLLYLYYDQVERQRSQQGRQERLIVRDFNIVFEDMVDFLLSDPPSDRQPKRLKHQHDGKIIDHLYEYTSLIGEVDTIFHVGDSKYYKRGAQIGEHSIYKQYTYARNLIYENIVRINSSNLPAPLRYRDDLTEGYNPTPNFFISATVDDNLSFSNPSFKFIKHYPLSFHFPDRLFDRDTLLLQHYSINFLYVLAAYVSPRSSILINFRSFTQQELRNKLLHYLNKHYLFYIVEPRTVSLEEFVTQNFRLLAGKMYRPSDMIDTILVAVPYGQESSLLTSLNKNALITPWLLR